MVDGGQDELTAPDFINTMKLESITVYPDGAFECWHNDGDLFCWLVVFQYKLNITIG
ncbi:DUF2262 domain-containing protein [Photobacterium kishitanii]|uniref:DUF2262 domain-containing protein n=1 Tax=Photobacterium kishitanii TaxID=318456 RepID=UPI000AF55BF7